MQVFFIAVFIAILPKFSDFVNSDDCMGKITSKSIRLQRVFSQKGFKVKIKQIFSSEKMKNSGDCIYNFAHSFFGEIFNPMRYIDKVFLDAPLNVPS